VSDIKKMFEETAAGMLQKQMMMTRASSAAEQWMQMSNTIDPLRKMAGNYSWMNSAVMAGTGFNKTYLLDAGMKYTALAGQLKGLRDPLGLKGSVLDLVGSTGIGTSLRANLPGLKTMYDNYLGATEYYNQSKLIQSFRPFMNSTIPVNDIPKRFSAVDTILRKTISSFNEKQSKQYFEEVTEQIEGLKLTEIIEEEINVPNIVSTQEFKNRCYRISVALLVVVAGTTMEMDEIQTLLSNLAVYGTLVDLGMKCIKSKD
jgi:hypothetical protein